MKTRVYFLDHLRTFMIFFVVLIHAGLVYEPVLQNAWIVIDQDQSTSIGLVRMYLDLFVMFTIFFISGYFVPDSVNRHSVLEFIKSKFKRIIIPWILAVLNLIPAYKAIFLYSRGLPQEEWYTYFHFYERAGSDLSFFANNPVQNWLWFLPVLFAFQLIYLAMNKSGLLNRSLSLKGGVLLTLVIGVVYSMLISEGGVTGWYHSALFHFQKERLLIYFMSFLLGSLCFSLRIFNQDSKNIKYYITANVVLTIALGIFTVVALNLFYNMIDPGRNYYFVSDFGDRLIYYTSAILSMLSFLYVLIHVFRFNLNKSNMLMNQINKSSYAVYIIHVVVLGVLALAFTNIHLPGFLKFILLAFFTFVFSNSIVYVYQRWVREHAALRIAAFGILVISLFAFIQVESQSNHPNKSESVPELPMPEIDLHEAVIKGDLQVVQQHIDLCADLDQRDATGGSSPLITAAFFGKTEFALLLIEAGADLNLQNNEGSTPLHTAAFFGRIDIVASLLEHGADRLITNNAGATALQSVSDTFESVKPIYDYFKETFGHMGLVIDYEQLKTVRPVIAEMLQLPATP